MDSNLLNLFFPKGLLEYFKVVSYKDSTDQIVFYLEELNIVPIGHLTEDLESKGFYEGGQITDFPLRGKRCIYKVRRRKWLVKSDSRVITRDWNILASGTRMTDEFASFLKEINRYHTH